jgi:hypothetical protein
MDIDDVPLLTDAVEEIEAPSILDVPEDDEAGADAWTETLTGSHPTEVGAPAGAAQSRIAAVPVASMAAGPIESIDISPPPPEESAVDRTWYDPNALAMPSTPPAEESSRLVAADTPSPPVDDVAPPVAEDAPAFGADDWTSRAVEAAAPPDDRVARHAHAFDEHEAHAVQATSALQSEARPEHGSIEPSVAPQPGALVEPEPQPVAAAATADEARWAQLAEEVRMQVLQRIDLFTDTGLREQLAARLQPIVDRASADLVTTINQHVGVLLRAYVAEAIEREIERWRDQSR